MRIPACEFIDPLRLSLARRNPRCLSQKADAPLSIDDRASALFEGTCGRGIYQDLTRDIEIFPIQPFRRRGRRDETSPNFREIMAEMRAALNIPRYATAIVTTNEIVDLMSSGQSMELGAQ